MIDKLLPCPFCGGDAEQDYQRSFRHLSGGRLDHGAAIYCTSCNADMIMCRADHPELSDEERMAVMVENWNRRAPAPQPNVRGWQPIETAPRDETRVLLYGLCRKPSVDAGKPAIVIGYWTNFNTGGWVWYGAAMEFTHWMPLPEVPALATTEGSEE